jgi:hypothetical protein
MTLVREEEYGRDSAVFSASRLNYGADMAALEHDHKANRGWWHFCVHAQPSVNTSWG